MRDRSRRRAARVRVTCRRLRDQIEILVDDDGPGVRPGCARKNLRAFLYRPAASRLWPEFRPRPFDLQADRRCPWRHHLGREPAWRRRGRTANRRCSAPASSCGCRPAERRSRRCAVDDRKATTVHASAVLVGARAVLIRGPSGAGKSRLALDLIAAAAAGRLRFARLVGDDRVHLEKSGGRLLVRPAAALAGLIELRGTGIRAS